MYATYIPEWLVDRFSKTQYKMYNVVIAVQLSSAERSWIGVHVQQLSIRDNLDYILHLNSRVTLRSLTMSR